MKRSFDLVIAAAGLVLLSPVLAGVAIAVRMSSGRPVVFRQVRVGLRFRPFCILKFRTMRSGHDAPLTVGDDPRLTSVGRWLRRTKLDELPQLWNVLRGDMSLVGPRPEIPAYVEQFRDDYEMILSIRPGITDEASLRYRREAQILAEAGDPQRAYVEEILPTKIALARQYVARRSFLGDLKILMRTVIGRL